MSQKILAAIGMVLLFGSTAMAQFYPTQYRPPNQNWQQLTTLHFSILFPAGEDSAAWKTARILEKEYPKVQQLTGGKLTDFPVILNDYNDRSNGFVTSLHFRSEIDISPIKGKTLNPVSGGWLQNVLPHELTHAVQFSHLGGVGLGQLVNLFSPDIARSMHGASPSGIQEGLAVYFESNGVVPDGGRGNYPFFTHQFDAIFDSPARWSMCQLVQFPTYSRPFNRHYIGGYEFTQWLQDTYGSETSRDAIDFNIRWPFLGYGVALKHATGHGPGRLYDKFEQQKEQKITARPHNYTALPIPKKGADIRRPKWITDSTLIFYGSFYNDAPGFYTYNLAHHTLKQKITTGSVSDYNYTLSENRNTVLYSYYRPDLVYPNAFKAALVQADLSNGITQNIIAHHRLYDPQLSGDSTLIALQTDHSTGKLVEIDLKTNRLVNILFADTAYSLIAAAVHPCNPDSLAVIMNHQGNQALWIASKRDLPHDLKNAPTLSFTDGSILDVVWHPKRHRLLLSADFSGILQIYEYDLRSGHLTQITNAPYNAFEASYSPDGNHIAFIIQRKNERLPVVLSRDQFYDKMVPRSRFNINISAAPPGLIVASSLDSTWNQHDYSTGFSWLKPRTVLPSVQEISGSNEYRVGAGLYSSDLLQQQAYSLELTTTEKRLWYDLTYQNKQFFPGLKARFFSRPAFRRFRFVTQNKDTLSQTFLRQERSFALSAPMQFTFKQNVDFTGLFIEPEIRLSQLRYFNEEGDNSSEFANATIANIFGQFNYNLRQNIRDVQPGRGLVLYSELEHYISSQNISLPVNGDRATLKSTQPTALRGGIFGYVAPLRRWNQSLRIGLQAVTQTAPVFDNQSIVSNGFANNIFPFSNNLLSINGRYTIPLFFPDNGGLLVPLYLSSIYLAAFSDTVWDPAKGGGLSSSRTVFGGGLRIRFRISNLSFDIGAGLALEPERHKIHYFIGDF